METHKYESLPYINVCQTCLQPQEYHPGIHITSLRGDIAIRRVYEIPSLKQFLSDEYAQPNITIIEGVQYDLRIRA